jgi:two-component system cell cycle sensor histidine kinase/response regulator CckA
MAFQRTILLVDDTLSLLTLAKTILIKAGYRVLTAADGGEAIRVAKEYGKPVDLLITDLTMPTMGGHELAKELRWMQPDVQVLFMSGDEDRDLTSEADVSRAWMLPKPFTPEELETAVRKIFTT